MNSEVLIRMLARVELKLKIDGLFLSLQSDGSGSVRTFDDRDVFRFDAFSLLVEWLHNPREIAYDEEGNAPEASGA